MSLFQGQRPDLESELLLRRWAFQEREEEQAELRALEAEEKERKTPCFLPYDDDPMDWQRDRNEDFYRAWESYEETYK